MKQQLLVRNSEIYFRDPANSKPVNDGVASVNDDASSRARSVLRYELQTFVCEKQYKKGLAHILCAYRNNLDRAQQPAVWVGGFFGSGKSHLVKMLRALWVDTKFDDGVTARQIANLPDSIHEQLKELSRLGQDYGGLQAASGTLGSAAAGSLRLSLAGIIFRSVGLPEDYARARFVLWLKNEALLESVQEHLKQSGCDWQEQLDRFYVATELHEALVKCQPELFGSSANCLQTLNNLFPHVSDISNTEMIKSIKQALGQNGKFPLTLVILDELEQYIGDDVRKAHAVQEVVETCCKNTDARLLFIGTGQRGLTENTMLQRLLGRFTVHITLSETDVDTVIRRVILKKKPEAMNHLEQLLQTNLGEISRHLAGTALAHQADDMNFFAQDYPVLPARKRFWQAILPVLVESGIESQLRNQLALVHKAVQTNLSEPIGSVIPGDFIYFDLAEKLWQAGLITNNFYETVKEWYLGSQDESLTARACALVFLINKLSDSRTKTGIRATVEAIADLMITDLSDESNKLRRRLPALLDDCRLLIKIGNEYRIQTEESAAWLEEFFLQRRLIAEAAPSLEAERRERLRQHFCQTVKKLSLVQGNSKITRNINLIFARQIPADSDGKLNLWVRDEWSLDRNAVQAEARQAGNQSPTVFVFIPGKNADELRRNIIDLKAATTTLERKVQSNTLEGKEARLAMDTTRQKATGRIKEIFDECLSDACVFQSGGQEITGNNLQDAVLKAAENALPRLYPHFDAADHTGWEQVIDLAKSELSQPLKAVGFEGEPANHPVSKAICHFVAAGKKGAAIRNHFQGKGFGWSETAIDAGLQILLSNGLVSARDEYGQAVKARDFQRKSVNKITFQAGSRSITAGQRIQLRIMLNKLGCSCQPGEEQQAVSRFLLNLQNLAAQAGGEAPCPPVPDLKLLDNIRLASGNDQLVTIYNLREELNQLIDNCTLLAGKIEVRRAQWQVLQELLNRAGKLAQAEEARRQMLILQQERDLLKEPDPLPPLIASVAEALRAEIKQCCQSYANELAGQIKELEKDSYWRRLSLEKRQAIMGACGLTSIEPPAAGSCLEITAALQDTSIAQWQDRIDAVQTRSVRARTLAAKLSRPDTKALALPRRTLKTREEIASWLAESKSLLEKALEEGPVVLQ